MTYQELINRLQKLPLENRQDTVTVYNPYTDEYTPVMETDVADENTTDVLDTGHFFLVLRS